VCQDGGDLPADRLDLPHEPDGVAIFGVCNSRYNMWGPTQTSNPKFSTIVKIEYWQVKKATAKMKKAE
jgi:hypothetical protein